VGEDDYVHITSECLIIAHPLGLSTGCLRFSRKLPSISQKGGPEVTQKSQNLFFVTKVAQKMLKKTNKKLLLGNTC